MTNRFEYTAPDGRYLRAVDREESGVWVVTSPFGCLVELDRVEEVVAGLRDMARQTGGQAATNQPAEAQPASTLPQLLSTTLTERFTALGNPFSRMSINFQGPDGWPATRDVSPNDVADVLRELLGQASGQLEPAQSAATFSVAERQFLTFALDLASDHMASRGDEFTDEDQAALDRFRSMSVDEP